MVAVGVAIVMLRAESAKAANRIQRLHDRQLSLERELWSEEMELARLRGPNEIRRRARDLGLNLVPPDRGPTPAGKIAGD